MKKLSQELLTKIVRTKSDLVDVKINWNDIYDTEEELIQDMLRVCAGDLLPTYKQPSGYMYIESFKQQYMLKGRLSDKQMYVLKKLAPEIAYDLYAKNKLVQADGRLLSFKEEGLEFKTLSYNFSDYTRLFREFREYLQAEFGRYCTEVEYLILSDDVKFFTLTIGTMTYNYPNEPDDFELSRSIDFSKSNLQCLDKGIKKEVGDNISEYISKIIKVLTVIGPVDILCLDFSNGNKPIAGICENRDNLDFFDEVWKLQKYVAYIKVA